MRMDDEDDEDAVRFIGMKASFPVDKKNRGVEILRAILALEDDSHFKKIVHGRASGNVRTVRFSESVLEEKLRLLESGTIDKLSLDSYLMDEDWVRSYENSPRVHWYSSVIEPFKRAPSPLEQRFGTSGHIIVEYPLSRFMVDSPSPFQRKLISALKRLFVKYGVHSAFVNQGLKPVHPAAMGNDYIFSRTRDEFPLSMFEYVLEPLGFSKEYLRGAFWTNFLNAVHMKNLGGIERVRNERPCRIIEELEDGRVLLQVGPSPLSSNEKTAGEDYQRLRRFLKPLLMETVEDTMRIQREVLGSWKPPESAENNFRELLAEAKKGDY